MKFQDLQPGHIFTFAGKSNEYWQKMGMAKYLNLSKGKYEKIVELEGENIQVNLKHQYDIQSKFGFRATAYDAWLKEAQKLADKREAGNEQKD